MKKILLFLSMMLMVLLTYAQSCPDSNHPHAIYLGLPSGTKCIMGTGKLIHASSSININSMFPGDCSQAFLLLPWFAKVGFLYPPPFPHGRQCSQNSRTILADGMIWCKYSAFPTLIQLLKAKIPKWGVTPFPLLK
jgi:hypothetical protein